MENKILVISATPFRNDSNMGKTLLMLFSEFDKNSLCQLYYNPMMPNVDKCESFYQVYDKQILGSFLGININKCGNILTEIPSIEGNTKPVATKGFFSRHKDFTIVKISRELLWRFSYWKNTKLKMWIKNEHPTVIFTIMHDFNVANNAVYWIAKKYKLPVIMFVTDDYYNNTAYNKNIISTIYYSFRKRSLNKLAKVCTCLIGCSDVATDYFSKKLNICLNKTIYTPSSPNVLTLPYKEISEKKPLKIRFFGNLGLGRWQVLQKIALALSELNEGSFKAKLEVYSSSSDSNIINALSIPNACSFMGWTYGAEYLYLLQDADIVVHAESFMPENIKKTWMSVSTKIADYLGAGKCILAVGPSEIASISHLRNVSFIIDNIKNLKDELYKLISDYDIRQDLQIKAREFANKEHNSKIIDLKIKESILQCLDKA